MNKRMNNGKPQIRPPAAVDVLGFPIADVTFEEALRQVTDFVRNPLRPDGHHVITANPELLMKALAPEGERLRRILQDASLVVADGIGVVWASRVSGKSLPERIPGIDLADGVLDVCAREGWRVVFVGAEPGVAQAAAERLSKKYEGLRVVGVHHGYFNDEEGETVAKQVGAAEADVVLVAMGVPKQEIWIATYRTVLRAKLFIGIGGALDVFAGKVQRAPVLWQKFGLEWAYRLMRQPRRARRMTAIPRFILWVLWHRWKGN